MSGENFEISRRKALAALGTIGAASAGAGLGTSAFFSDSERFEGNTLTAGELDLKVDWEEHYSDWSDDESKNLDNEVLMSEPDDTSNYVGLPDPMNPLIWVHTDDLGQFMDNTAVEAYPDTNDDGVQDSFGEGNVGDICVDGADTPEDLNPANGLRTSNDDTLDEDDEPKPLVSLEDVKPGDFGELTLSFHLCDNDGYVWLQGSNVAASENGLSEPESKDPDEGPGVELLDAIQTVWWYDEDGDNVIDEGTVEQEGETADVMIVLDRSGSMDPQGEPNKFQNAKDGAKSLVDALGPGAQVGLVSFSDQGTVDEPLGSARQDVKDSIDGLSAGGTTNIADAISDAQSELAGGSGDNQYMVVLSNGVQNTGGDARGNATAAKDAGIHIISIAYGSGADQNLMEDISSPDKVDDGTIDDADENAFVGEITDIDDVFDDIGDIIVQQTGEQVFRRGTLGSDLEALSTDDGIPLDGDLSTDYDEIGGIGNETDPELGERECFAASETHYIGFAWYLPVDHANEIQTDSVVFNLGFYTEQCRHNDGSGQSGTNLQISGKRGNGFAKVQENYNGDQTISGGARARFGGQNTWELAVGDAPGSSNFSQGEYSWTSGKTVDWMVSYDDSSDELSFTFDGNTISQTLSSEPSGRIAVQGKADEATVEIDDLSLSVDGGAPDSPVPDGVTATNDGTGREIRYLSIDPGFDGSQSFEYSGTTTVSLQGDFPGGDEDVAFDVVVE